MKKCDEIIELLSLYIDNELNESERQIVKEHIESCDACKNELDQLNSIVEMCNDIDELELPGNFKETLHQKLSIEKQNHDNQRKILFMRNRIMKAVSSVAAVLLVVFVVRGFMNTDNLTSDTKSSDNSAKLYTDAPNNRSGDRYIESEKTIAWNSKLKEGIAAGQAPASEADIHVSGSVDDDSQQHSLTIESSNSVDTQNIDGAKTSAVAAATGSVSEPDQTPNAADITVAFSSAFNENIEYDANTKYYTIGSKYVENSDFFVELASGNINIDTFKISKIAERYGLEQVESTDDAETSAVVAEYGGTARILSFDLDKSNYDVFVSELSKNFSGRFKVTDNFEQLKSRLDAVDKEIKENKGAQSSNPDELNNLEDEKENILQKVDERNTDSLIRITIIISGN